MDRKILYSKIDRRVDLMVDEGLIMEAKKAKDKGYDNIDAIGYRHIFDYFEGKLSLEKALELTKKDTRNYAKRQLTWFRADKRIDWYDYGEYDKIEKSFNEWLKENGV